MRINNESSFLQDAEEILKECSKNFADETQRIIVYKKLLRLRQDIDKLKKDLDKAKLKENRDNLTINMK
jgi:hypothetical protein